MHRDHLALHEHFPIRRTELLRESGGDYAVRLKSGARLDVSRGRVAQLERWMGV